MHITLPDGTEQKTGAIRIMINMLASLRKDVPAAYVACVFDAKGPTFRDAIYPQYKAQRTPMPDDLRSQIEPIHEVVRLLGWKVLNVPGVEADDVIGTLAVIAAAQGVEVVVSSGDKDLAQLVNQHITIIDTMNGKRRDLAGVEAEFGVPAHLMVDYQILVGDTVDNVPGVEKVGPKTAAKWLQEYGSLDAVVANAANIKGVVGENLRKAVDWLPTGRQLLTIKTDCELTGYVDGLPALDAVAVGPPQTGALAEFYDKYGFKGLARSLAKSATTGPATGPATAPGEPAVATATGGSHAAGSGAGTQSLDLFGESPDRLAAPQSRAEGQIYDTVLTWDAFNNWLAKVEAADLVAVDTETTSLDEMVAQIVGISVSVKPGEAAYVPLTHDYPGAPAQLPRDEVLARLKPWLENSAKKKLGQHVKYDRHIFANHGIEVRVTRTTPCCKVTCWRSTNRMGWRVWLSGTWGAAASVLKTCAAKARIRSPSTRSISPKPPNTRVKTLTRPWTCIWRCGRSCKPTPSCSQFMSWRWPVARRFTASNVTAC